MVLKNGGLKISSPGDKIMNVLYTMNVKDISNAWVLSNLPTYIEQDHLDMYFGGKLGRMLQLAEICQVLRGKFDDFTLEEGDSIYNYGVHTLGESPSIVIPPKWKTEKLNQSQLVFNLFMWPHWKEGALAVFSRCGLYRVVSNPDFALENPEMNAVVQGMLTIVL
jgi:hypothetical protein